MMRLRTCALTGLVLASMATVSPTGVAGQADRTLLVGIPDWTLSAQLDPTGEYTYGAWTLHSNLLSRTLVTYRHSAGPEGLEPVPDLAEALPEISDDRLTYTFRLKPGVMFGPPLDRPVTSDDVKYAFARIKCSSCGPAYPSYFRTIKGMRPETSEPEPGSISGIETPDPSTIIFHLKKPTGDFLHRLALPATTPIPFEVAECGTGRRGLTYGRSLVSTGPYMIEGADDQPFTGCHGLTRWSGFTYSHLNLVRNPAYDPATDDLVIRENLIDRFEFTIFEDDYELFAAVDNGELDTALAEPPPAVKRSFAGDPERQDWLRTDPNGAVYYVTMNLTQPPFDDVYVRRAVNWALNKKGLARARGGSLEGTTATHILPPETTGRTADQDDLDPFDTPDDQGDIAKARAAMVLSDYDRDGDGLCDARACDDVTLLNRNDETYLSMEPYVRRALEKIGIDATIIRRRYPMDYITLQDPGRGISVAMMPGWQRDYGDGSSVMDWLFHSRHLRCNGNVNYSLVGADQRYKHRCRLAGSFDRVPNVDDQIEACEAILPEDDRRSCWHELDRHLMEEVVPWVPYSWDNAIRIVGPAVTRYGFDQFTGEMALAHMDVDASARRP